MAAWHGVRASLGGRPEGGESSRSPGSDSPSPCARPGDALEAASVAASVCPLPSPPLSSSSPSVSLLAASSLALACALLPARVGWLEIQSRPTKRQRPSAQNSANRASDHERASAAGPDKERRGQQSSPRIAGAANKKLVGLYENETKKSLAAGGVAHLLCCGVCGLAGGATSRRSSPVIGL